MFALLREKLNMVEVAEELLQSSFKEIGEGTWEQEDKTCPFCGHKDCFRIKLDGADSYAHCFSEGKTWDVTAMTAELKELSMAEAGKLLAKHYEIDISRDFNPVQELLNMAGQYYHACFMNIGPQDSLGGLTPLEFQIQKRGHKEEFLSRFRVGWSDGGLIEYLTSIGTPQSLIEKSGLANKKGTDFFPFDSFIYPHKVRGMTSHFTFKDPLKRKEYQFPNKFKLNGHSFYNSDTLSRQGSVIVVEGENDTISVEEAGWTGPVICTIGSISGSQLDWMVATLENRDVITIYDSDDAGNKYREKTRVMSRGFKSLTQVLLPTPGDDIDDFLRRGNTLEDAFKNVIPNTPAAIASQSIATSSSSVPPTAPTDGKPAAETPEVEVEPQADDLGILVKKGGYYKVRYKDGNEFHIKLTNFTIELLNIFIRGEKREREIVIHREDGRSSSPIMINSEDKVSLKLFKTLVANAIDASFYGKEDDLITIWEYVYRTSRETLIKLPECIGRIPEAHGWLFGDCFISDDGATYLPDEKGVIHISGTQTGLRPVSMETGGATNSNDSIPCLFTGLGEDQRNALIKSAIEALATNLGDLGMAISMFAWCWAGIYSDEIFKEIGFFPPIYSWGRQGGGKTTINKWLLALFDLDGPGWNPVYQLNSGVSFSRKLSYYSSLPMCIDELRTERSIIDMYGTFRSWYNRGARTVSAKDTFGVRTQPIRSTVFFAGEDQFVDDATRTRCVHFRIPKQGREEVVSYGWLKDKRAELPAVGYHWIVNRHKYQRPAVVTDLRAMDKDLRAHGASPRTSLNWAVVAIFGRKLAEQYIPEFDFMGYIYDRSKEDTNEQQEDNALNDFWSLIEGLQTEERARIGTDHFERRGNDLVIWFPEVFRVAQREDPRGRDAFSKKAILGGIHEEPYFIRDDRLRVGLSETIRRVIVVDIDKAPEPLQHIASYLG